MRTSLILVLLFWSEGARPEVFVVDSHYEHMSNIKTQSFWVGGSREDALAFGRRGGRVASIIHECKPGGWFAFITTNDGGSPPTRGYAGSCNHRSREMAKDAAIKSCRQKPACSPGLHFTDRSGGWDLASGQDDGKFDAKRIHELWDNWTPKGENRGYPAFRPMSSDYEMCFKYGSVAGACHVFADITESFIERSISADEFIKKSYPYDISKIK